MHFRAGHALADGHVQLAIRSAVPVASRGEIHASPAFAFGPVAHGAVTQKILAAGCQVGRRVEGILVRKIPVSAIRSILPFLRQRKTHACQEAESDSEYASERPASVFLHAL